MNYWMQRVGMAVLLLLAVSMLTFGAMNLLGDPLFNILGPVAADRDNPESLKQIDAAEAEFYLDEPLPERYVRWLGDFVTGDMGPQFSKTGEPPVTDLIKERLPRSAMLLIMAQIMAIVISIPWSLWSAAKANTAVDKVSTFTTFLIIALPELRARRDPQVRLRDQTRMVPADVRRQRPVPDPGVPDCSCRRSRSPSRPRPCTSACCAPI